MVMPFLLVLSCIFLSLYFQNDFKCRIIFSKRRHEGMIFNIKFDLNCSLRIAAPRQHPRVCVLCVLNETASLMGFLFHHFFLYNLQYSIASLFAEMRRFK